MTQTQRIRFENGLIALLALTSLTLLILSFLPASRAETALLAWLEIGRMVQRAFSILLLAAAWELRRRRRAALELVLFLFLLQFLQGLTRLRHPGQGWLMAADLFFFAAFLCLREDFCCPSSPRSKRQALTVLLLSLVGIAANAALSYHYLSAFAGVRLLKLILFWFSWLCILAALFYAARPWIIRRSESDSERQHARTLLNLYSQNCCSYLALEDDKQLYFGRCADGVIPYGAVGDTIIVNGDPVCADADFPALLAEFKEFCQKTAHKIFFLSVTDRYLDEYRRQGFGCVKCGEEARFSLADYEISGKKGAKMRMNINHARKAGITVHEYKPLQKRDPAVEAAFDRVTAEWLQQKKSSLLTFTMGKAGLDNPMDKRYFYAADAGGHIVAFIAFVPFLGKSGYMADVTRHGNDAPGGVMETIIYEAFQTFKAEGVAWGSLGVAPLAGLEEGGGAVERLLAFVYRNLNDCYGFRDLYRAKEKYSPTEWLPAYYVYLPKIPTPDMFWAVVEIQNPQGILEGLRALVRGRLAARRSGAGKETQNETH